LPTPGEDLSPVTGLAMVLPAFSPTKRALESMESAMRIFLAAAVGALLAGSAYAQMPPMGIPFGEPRKEKPVDPAKESDYRSSLGGLPDRKASDPWGNIRSSEPAPGAKKSPPKTGAAAKKDGTTKNAGAPKPTPPKGASAEKKGN
jgi:hypothetical protein